MQIRFIRTLLFALLFALVMLCMSTAAFAQVGVGIVVNFAPPPLPVYEQPICPEDGYIWTPGYWAYGDDFDDYYWVPGTWVLAPEVGFLWTPAYWGWGSEGFVFYDGYWGPVVGFYGGINYGFGYFGEGYEGGRWESDHFFYNSSVNNVNQTVVHNVYNQTVVVNNETHVSYNGGNGGVNARPTPQQEAAAHEKHIPPVAVQTQHAQAARTNPQQRASVNMGKPPVAATPKPGVFDHPAVVPAKAPGAPYTPPANRGANRGGNQTRNNNNTAAPANPAPRPETSAPRPDNNASRPGPPAHPSDLPPAARSSAPNTGNPKLDQKYQQQQEKVFAKQEQERQKLQQRQDQEHQRLAQQNASEAEKQQVEQRHQQQTQQLQQRHEQQQQQLQQKQPQQKQQPPSRDRSKPPN